MNAFLEPKLARQIVIKTMQIINVNVNVMDATGKIIASGDPERIGELHEGALLVLSQGRIVEVDNSMAEHLYGVRPGTNLPLKIDGKLVGVIGLTGNPVQLRQYGELVCMAAEMMVEQAKLLYFLAQDNRLREELVHSLIRADEISPMLKEWAERMGIDLAQPRVAVAIEIDSGQLDVENPIEELQELQSLLARPEEKNLIAIISLTELAVLRPAFNKYGRWDEQEHLRQFQTLLTSMKNQGHLRIRFALGNYFPGRNSIARSWQTAHSTMVIGKRRLPQARCYNYRDLKLPVLLQRLQGGWQETELLMPITKLKLMDKNGQLQRTLEVWFQHNNMTSVAANALFIHRHTLDYRLSRIEEITGLKLSNLDDRLALYIAVQLDGESRPKTWNAL
ncbi:sugar diacid recognition domain-containing protein [Martelella alba]|uniref:Carbohydrate diacid regulon transcriptional regulator CdaR n=1 Tax=Martelella alba TaxID=2590451 RepID=A0ABY2SJ42_9HYPH|nr:sugar diacid recognition domain-containing protein [Martelella alba]TKI05187.1 carbohydrate diacid regulon transcriptional regulator CdaR [Martelella alba]